jgi:N-acetylglucosamine kinase-like BadF-type ATPase
MSYFLGVDVGGTKTHAIIADEKGVTAGFAEVGPGNHESVGYEGLSRALQEAMHAALAHAGLEITNIGAGGFGIAGYDWPSERARHLDAIATLGLRVPVELVNDTVVGLLAGASAGWGVAVVSGTGDNCWGRDWNKHEAHMTGCGSLFGEFGGAGSLVERAVQSISYEWGMRGPSTRLTPAFIGATDASSLDDMLEGLSQARYWVDGSQAPLVFEIAKEGDEVAREVVAWAGRQLASMVHGISRQLKFEDKECQVVMIGSMFKNGGILVDPFVNEVRKVVPQAQFIRLDVPPVVGGVILAMEQAGVKADAHIRENLADSIKKILVEG